MLYNNQVAFIEYAVLLSSILAKVPCYIFEFSLYLEIIKNYSNLQLTSLLTPPLAGAHKFMRCC